MEEREEEEEDGEKEEEEEEVGEKEEGEVEEGKEEEEAGEKEEVVADQDVGPMIHQLKDPAIKTALRSNPRRISINIGCLGYSFRPK